MNNPKLRKVFMLIESPYFQYKIIQSTVKSLSKKESNTNQDWRFLAVVKAFSV